MMSYRRWAVVGGVFLVVAWLAPACDDSGGSDDDDGAGATTSTSGGAGGGSGGTTSTSGTAGAGGQPLLTCLQDYTSVEGECDVLNPFAGCEPGFWCDIINKVATCTSVQGKGVFGPGQPCSGHTECAPGLRCQMDKCSPVCCPADDQPCDAHDGTCNIKLNLGGDDWVQMCSYLPACTIFENTCDPQSGYQCHIQDDAACLSVCAPPSNSQVAEGEVCEFLNDCGESQVCNDNLGDSGVCRHLCDINTWETDQVGSGGCPTDRTCQVVTTACADWDFLGICMPSSGG